MRKHLLALTVFACLSAASPALAFVVAGMPPQENPATTTSPNGEPQVTPFGAPAVSADASVASATSSPATPVHRSWWESIITMLKIVYEKIF